MLFTRLCTLNAATTIAHSFHLPIFAPSWIYPLALWWLDNISDNNRWSRTPPTVDPYQQQITVPETAGYPKMIALVPSHCSLDMKYTLRCDTSSQNKRRSH